MGGKKEREPRKSIEFTTKNKGRFKELTFHQISGNFGNIPGIIKELGNALIKNQAYAARMSCEINDGSKFGEKFNPAYDDSIRPIIQPLPARFTTLGEDEVSIGMTAVVPNKGLKFFAVEPTPPLPDDATPAIGPYSPGIIVKTKDGDKEMHYLYVSGQLAFVKGEDGKAKFAGGGLKEQTDIAWNNTLTILNAAGMNPADLTKLHVIVTSDENKAEVEKIMEDKLGKQNYELVTEKKGLVIPDALVEIVTEAETEK